MTKYTTIFLRRLSLKMAMLLLVALAVTNTQVGAQCKDWVPVGGSSGDYTYIYQPIAIDGAGTIYTASRDAVTEKLAVRKYSGGSWITIGSSLSVGSVDDMDIKVDASNTPYVAFVDHGISAITVLKYNGSSWVTVGAAGFSAATFEGVSLAFDATGAPYVAFNPGSSIAVMKFNGSSWVYVGSSGVTGSNGAFPSLAFDNTTGDLYLAYRYDTWATVSYASVMKYNGSSWSTVGATNISGGSVWRTTIAVGSTGVPYLAYGLQPVHGPVVVKTFDGSSWNTLGGSPAISSAVDGSYIALGPGDVPYVATNMGDGQVGVAKFNGTSWVMLGTDDDPYSSLAQVANLAVAPDGIPYVSYNESGSVSHGVVKKYETISSTITGTAALCTGATTTFTHSQPGGYWSSTVSSVATLGSTGVVTATSAGLTSISYTIGHCSASKTVTVNPYAGTIAGPLFLTQGTSTTFSSNVGGGTWSVSNSNATITSGGALTGVTAGTTTVSYAVSSSCGVAYETKLVTIVATPPACHTWSQAGDVISPIGSGTATIEMDGSGVPYVSYVDGYTMTGFIKKFNGSTWQSLGADALGSGLYSFSTAVSPLGVVYAVTADASGTHTYRNEGSGWQVIANPVEYAEGVTLKTDAAGTLYATHTGYDPTLGLAELRLAKYNGSTWDDLGLVGYFYGAFQMAFSGTTPYVAFDDDANARKITVRKYTGSAWVNVGSPLSVSEYTPSLAVNSSGIAYLALTYFGSYASSHVFKFDGTSWAESAFPDAELMYPSVTMDPAGTPYLVGTSTSVEGGAVVFRNDGAGWIPYTRAAYYADVPTGVVDANGNIFLVDHVLTGSYSLVSMKYAPSEGLPAITGPTSLCEGGYETLSNAVPLGVWSTSDPSVVALFSSNSGDILGYFPGTATISYTNGSCSATVDVTVNAYGALPDIAGASNVCNTGTTTLTNTAPGGMWSSSDPSKATVDYSSGVVSGVSVGSAIISYTLGSGCASTVAWITVDPPADPGVISGVDSMCMLSETTFSSSVSGGIWDWHGTLPYGYIHSEVGYFDCYGIDTAGILVPTPISIVYKVENACGVDSAVKNVIVKPRPIRKPIVGPTHLCIGETVTYTYTGGSPMYWYSPMPGSLAVDSFTGVVTVLAMPPAVYGGVAMVQQAWINEGSCPIWVGFKNVRVDTGAPAAPTISGASTVAQGSTVTFTGSDFGGNWSASNSNVTVIDATPGDMSYGGGVTGVSAGGVTVSYTLTNGCGTSVGTKSMTVTLPPIVGPMVITGAGTTTLSNSMSGGAWSTACSNIVTVTASGVVTGVSNGLATVTYTVGGDYTTAVVTVNMASSALTGILTACAGAVTTLSHPVSGGEWSSGNTSVATVSVGGIVSGVSAGSANISYAYGSGCSSISAVTINPLANAGTITGAASVCVGSTLTLNNVALGGVWSSSNSSVATAGSSTGIVSGMSAGNATITYTVSNSCGSVTATKAITVNAATASTITGTASLCIGATTTLANVTTGGIWTSSDPAIASVGAYTGIVTGVGTGNATITYTISGACGSATATKVVTVGATASITGTLSLCSGMTSSLSGSTTGGVWTSGNTAVATIGAANGVLTAMSIGTANITYAMTGGCTATAVVTVSMPAIIAGTSNACVGQTATLTDATAGGVWSSVGSSRVDLQACKLEYSIVSPK